MYIDSSQVIVMNEGHVTIRCLLGVLVSTKNKDMSILTSMIYSSIM